ncbi:DUF6049 family protein [Agromyces aureus]|uniref:2-oxoglutarate dehydrogenase n=1 Tax=Agromyces aureus TaxID=453304 RepID=A0A191WJS0_9MICO|nr:DUF6049 family protein [Agromyces aureus]ANJ28575.1 hypothetical protein ATC03_19590 [Agromyces aureus]
MADSNAARRRARRRVGSSGATGVRRTLVFSAAAVAAATLVLVPLAASTTGADPVGDFQDVLFGTENAVDPSAGASASGDAVSSAAMLRGAVPEGGAEGVLLSIAPTLAPTYTPGTPTSPVTITVELENRSGSFVEAGSVRLVRSAEAIGDDSDLDAWLATLDDGAAFGSASVSLGEATSRTLAAGGVTQVAFTVPAAAFDDLADSPVVGLGAELKVGDTVVSTGTSAFANTAVASAGAPIALVAPITVPASADGLISSDDLSNWTSPSGLLTRQLDALGGRQIAIGIDPRIIASIRVLGTSAPVTATAWLDRLAALPNETFPLAYADADLALEAQTGLPAPLQPTSFADVLDPDDFVPDPAIEQNADADPSVDPATPAASPTPVPTEPVSPVPTIEALLSWPYTRADIAWPGDRTVGPGNLAFFNAAGLTTTVLDAGNVEPLDGARASALVDGGTAIVSDDDLTEAVRAAGAAATDLEWRDATGEVLARAALDGSTNSSDGPLLATFGRDYGLVSDRVGDLLDEMAAAPFVSLTGLAQAIGAPPTARSLVDSTEDQARRTIAGNMITVETDVDAFASVLEDPTDLTGPVRRQLLALLDVGWLATPTEWSTSATEWIAAQHATVDSISVVPSSTVLVVASETGIPVTIQNTLSLPVTVQVDVAPSNGRLVVDEPVQVTVEPESRNTVIVPVAAGVGNGEVRLAVSLQSLTGVSVGSTVMITADVRADWEGLGAAILGSIVIIVFGIGLWRNIRRRRRARAADAAAAASDEQADAEASEPSELSEATANASETKPNEPVAPSEPNETSERRDD